MTLKLWWVIPFIGLICWMGMAGSIARKNFDSTLINSVMKPRNDMVKIALAISMLTILNGALWLLLGRGIIINIFQQALLVVFQTTVFSYALKIFDPVQRWASKAMVKKYVNVVKLFLGVFTLVLAVLVRVEEVYEVDSLEEHYEFIALYFLIIDFILCLFSCYFIWAFFNFYISVRRGINYNSAEVKEPEVFDLRKRWMIDNIDLASFSHEIDPHCLNVLKIEKIMLERLMFYMFLVLAMNVYKLSWGSSQYECSSRVSCSPSITERNFQRAINSLSYWLPDLIYMVVWQVVLLKPIVHVRLPEERLSDCNEKGCEHGDEERDVTNSRDTTDNLSFDTDDTGIKLSLFSNAASVNSGKFSPLEIEEANGDPKFQELREIAISCQEMILFHRESGIPVATLFAGRDTFAVLSMRGSSRGMAGKHLGSDDWVEVGRSDCRVNKANPFFHAAFVVPDSPPLVHGVEYRIALFNSEDDSDLTFHPDNADLASHEMVASVHLTQKELHDLTESEACEKPANEMGMAQYRSKSKQKDMTMTKIASKFSELYIGTGGKMLISARKVRPFSQQFGELNTVNDLLQAKLYPQQDPDLQDKAAREGNAGRRGGGSSDIFKNDALVRSFIATTTGQGDQPFDVILREELVESPYSFDVPAALLRSLIPERVMELEILIERLGYKDVFVDEDTDAGGGDSLEWSSEFIRSITTNVEVMRKAVHHYENTDETFKKSKDKSNKELEFVPINLHVHIFEMSSQHSMRDLQQNDAIVQREDDDKNFICDFITVGAFAAHSKKFKQGGLWHLMKQFEYRLKQLTPASSGPLGVLASGDLDFLLPHHIWGIEVLQHLPLDPLLLHLAFKARERFDICVSQCMSALAAGFLARIKLMTPAVVEKTATIGMLFQFESLLSTQGHELGMLSDFFCTFKFMDFVQIRVFEMSDALPGEKQTSVRVYREHELFILDLGFGPGIFQGFPEMIQRGCGIAVVPVMFSVGVNELQTYAETVAGKKAFHLQDLINKESLARIEAYFALVKRYDDGDLEDEKATIRESLSLSPAPALEDCVSERRQRGQSSSEEGGGRKKKRVSNSDALFVEDIMKVAKEGSTLWLQTYVSSSKRLNSIRDRMDSTSLSKDFELGSATWGDVERGVGGFSLWNGTKKKDKRASHMEEEAALKADLEAEGAQIDDDDDDSSIHRQLYILAKEKVKEKPELSAHAKETAASVLSTQVNPLSEDIETGPNSFDETRERRSVSRAPNMWHLDHDDDEHYEEELEKELESLTSASSRTVSGSCSVSDAILQVNADSSTTVSGTGPGRFSSKEDRLLKLLNRLRGHITDSQGMGGKPYQILTDAAKLTRALDGVRLTSCKSAKDRTGMSVTLEEAHLAQEIYGLSAYEAKNLLISMRQHGVRLANTKKNVGKACFSFNRFQRKFLPPVYQPPTNVMGKVDS